MNLVFLFFILRVLCLRVLDCPDEIALMTTGYRSKSTKRRWELEPPSTKIVRRAVFETCSERISLGPKSNLSNPFLKTVFDQKANTKNSFWVKTFLLGTRSLTKTVFDQKATNKQLLGQKSNFRNAFLKNSF